jgi:hypothetical protein
MYGYNNMPPPWMWPTGPTSTPPQNPVEQISQWIAGLDALKKHMKEEKKEEKKKEPPIPSIFGMMLLMLLLSPITGPLMYNFFQASLRMLK